MVRQRRSYTGKMVAISRQIEAKYKNKRYKFRGTDFHQETEGTVYEQREEWEDLPKVSYCWCGEKYPHEWEGRSEGKPHPR